MSHPSSNTSNISLRGCMPVILIAPNWVRVGEAHSYKRLTPAARLGEHTKSILEELGYKQEEIKALLCNGVVSEYLSALGGKDTYLFTQKKQLEIEG